MNSLLKSTLNTRFLPYYSQRFIRSDVLYNLLPEDIKWLKDNNVTSVIDLRSDKEILKKQCTLENNIYFRYIHLPITGGDAIPDSEDAVIQSYIAMADSNMKAVLHTVLNAPQKVIFFCNAGKDRTGTVSALLLKTMGIDNNVIIDDYMQSKNNLSDMLSSFIAAAPDKNYSVIIPQRRYMEEFLSAPEILSFIGEFQWKEK